MDNHSVTIENREKVTVTAVADVTNAKEDAVTASLLQGGVLIKGQNLHIQRLDVEEGCLVVEGDISSVVYTERKNKGERDLLKRLLK